MCGTSWNRRATLQADAAPLKASLDMVARLIADHYASKPDDHVISIGDWRDDPILGAPMREFVAYLQMPLGDFRAAIAAGGAQEALRLTADDADMFWPEHDGEQMYHSLDDAVTAVFEDSGANPGDEFEFTCAARLPKVKVRIIDVTENGFEWEIAGPAASNGEQA